MYSWDAPYDGPCDGTCWDTASCICLPYDYDGGLDW